MPLAFVHPPSPSLPLDEWTRDCAARRYVLNRLTLLCDPKGTKRYTGLPIFPRTMRHRLSKDRTRFNAC
jgi:hypothetical protein